MCGSPARRAGVRRAARRRRRGVARRSIDRSDRAGIVDTCVLRIVSRRRWKSPPSGSDTSFAPYQDATRATPSCDSSPSAVRSASGLPDTSITSGTPAERPSDSSASGSSSGETASMPSPPAASRRHGWVSTASTRAPARCSNNAVNVPTAPRPNRTTGSPNTAPASRVICNAVSTSGNIVACRGSADPSGTTSTALATKRS